VNGYREYGVMHPDGQMIPAQGGYPAPGGYQENVDE